MRSCLRCLVSQFFGKDVLNSVFESTISGESGGKINCLVKENSNTEILIMGSSRAARNIKPDYFKSHVFNLGHNGMYDYFQLNLLNYLIEQNINPNSSFIILIFIYCRSLQTLMHISLKALKALKCFIRNLRL